MRPIVTRRHNRLLPRSDRQEALMILSRAQRRGLDGKAFLLGYIDRTGYTIAGDKAWTRDELNAMRRLYPDAAALSVALPCRSPAAIGHKARHMGLVVPRKIWSQAEILALRRPYISGMPVQEIERLLPGRSRHQIWHRAHRSGFRRPRIAPRPTGIPIVDAVRLRAHDHRLTMGDLDAFVGKRRYFVSPRRIDWNALQRAMTMLGGIPFIVWNEL